jgi:hypothetical protein
VRVSVNGQPLVTKLDGQAVPADPGLHTFRFEQTDGTSATQTALVKEGDRNVAVAVAFEAPAVKAPEPVAPSPPAASSEPPAASQGGLGARRTIGLT